MSDIALDPVQLRELFAGLQPSIDDVYNSLRDIPYVNGGIASNMIALIASAGAEASQVVADSRVALMALVLETISDFEATEESVTQELNDFKNDIEQS